ncbi:type I-B CRISPR-associated endonuclease Cas1b [Defluviitalea raffinosedens]|uniref:type I-B CRISPR-associated endonuclease Cas1b n=1 Tax=Defluviitalea raffinosedens TaxID=1450156 RepID=UPI00195DF848|nr:type I-B CRISPR-associated endonuclease Cas1b [Defluviitalea raffinosedens]MBM7687163.1 CRISPR-associated protein Cas1 [Defluviitalea raffinosedens]
MKRSYYIMKSGRIRRKDNTIFFESDDNKKVLPINDIDDIYIMGEVDFNSNALNFLGKNKVMVHIFDYYGNYSGSFYPKEYLLSGFTIVKQAEKYLDPGQRLQIAREFIRGASYNILKNLKYYQNRKGNLDQIIEAIETERERIGQVQDIQHLMSVEGRIRETYYRAFDIITDNKFPFVQRVKHPPDNAMNAMISFGNHLMYTAILREIYQTQLNPTISYLHEPGARKFSLALDISEIFKPIIVDRVIFSLINQNVITEEDFAKELNYCYLNETGRKKFIKAFDEKMTSTIQHRKLNKTVSYKTLIQIECYKLIKHLTDIEEYEAFQAWW